MGPHKFRPYLNDFTMKFFIVLVALVALAAASPAPEEEADLAAPAPERCTSTMMDRYNKWCCKNGYWDKGCSNYMKAGCSCQFKVEERAEPEEAVPLPADLAAPWPEVCVQWYNRQCCNGKWPYGCTKYMRSHNCSCRGK